MTDIYLHGIETVEKNTGPRPVATIDTGIIGAVVTAPNADEQLWPLNVPVAVHGANDFPEGLGTGGTARDVLESIFMQATRASQTVVLVRVEQGVDFKATRANVLGDPLLKTGMWALLNAWDLLRLKPKLLIAPGFDGVRPTDGIAGATISVRGTGYTEAPTLTATGGGGSGLKLRAIINDDGELDEVIIEDAGYGYTTAPTVAVTGGGGELAAVTLTVGTVKDPVAAGLEALAGRLRAGVILNGPNTTNAGAVAYRADFDTDRVLIVDPYGKFARGGSIVTIPSSAAIAGLQAVVDYEEGFWCSPSNHVIKGLLGTSRSIQHSMSDPSAESQYLNKNDVATIVRAPSGGWKLWGSRVPSSDPMKKFWSVRRAHDTIIESIELAHEPFIDKPFSLQALTDIAETVNNALRRWKALGATLGGRVWLDPSINTKETWMSGKLYVSYDAEGPAPIEQITFMFSRNTGYYEELAQNAIREIARLSGRAI